MDKLLQFVEFTRKFRAVDRMVQFPDGRHENDAEHSYQLALIAWYILSKDNLSLDTGKVLKYALIHDLVEVYAGDTPAAVHRNFEEERSTKEEREELAARRMQDEFPEFNELHDLIHKYEERGDEEARFVYALDKMMPIFNIYLDKGHSWKVYGVKIEDVIEYKKDKIAESKEVKKYFDLIIPLIEGLDGLGSK